MLLSIIPVIGRAMGETMAVTMVTGSVDPFSSLFGKGESIALMIALEMGTVVVGSAHYHTLYVAGLVPVLLLLFINSGIALLRGRPEQ